MSKALIVIDIQNDYFPSGKYPQFNSEEVLKKTLVCIRKAIEHSVPVVLIQHIAGVSSPFFAEGSEGADLHPEVLRVATDAAIVIKQHADSFLNTNLQSILSERHVTELLICGMMTQNCVTHTALSESADAYGINVLSDCCTSVDEMVHAIALRALSDRVALVSCEELFD